MKLNHCQCSACPSVTVFKTRVNPPMCYSSVSLILVFLYTVLLMSSTRGESYSATVSLSDYYRSHTDLRYQWRLYHPQTELGSGAVSRRVAIQPGDDTFTVDQWRGTLVPLQRTTFKFCFNPTKVLKHRKLKKITKTLKHKIILKHRKFKKY